MIAELSNRAFSNSTFSIKIDYHNSKIEKGNATLLYSSLGLENGLDDFKKVSEQVVRLNDRIKQPYHEVSLNLVIGETLDDNKFINMSNEYMKEMGYDNTSYAVIRHTDKEHSHVHILFTAVDLNGKSLNRSKERFRSQKISRALEKKYGLVETKYNKFKNEKFSEIKAREYYFHQALLNGFKSFSLKDQLGKKMEETILPDITQKALTNSEYEIILGSGLYQEIGDILDKSGHFNKLYKDELLFLMDNCLSESTDLNTFRQRLDEEGVYMRLVTDKGQSKYVYGLINASFYVKESSLPKRYRHGELSFNNPISRSSVLKDEQKHILYNTIFIVLKNSNSYEEFKRNLEQESISVIEHENSRGVYGLSFSLMGVDNAEVFKASDISRRLSYNSIEKYYNKFEPVISEIVSNNAIIDSVSYDLMKYYPAFASIVYFGQEDKYDKEVDDEIENEKKKKKRRREIRK